MTIFLSPLLLCARLRFGSVAAIPCRCTVATALFAFCTAHFLHPPLEQLHFHLTRLFCSSFLVRPCLPNRNSWTCLSSSPLSSHSLLRMVLERGGSFSRDCRRQSHARISLSLLSTVTRTSCSLFPLSRFCFYINDSGSLLLHSVTLQVCKMITKIGAILRQS